MKRALIIGVILGVLGFGTGRIWCETVDSSHRTVAREDFESKYRDGMQMEQLRLFPQAKGIYVDIGRQFIRMSETGRPKEALLTQLPVVLSAVYRMGIVTARDNYYNVHPLVYQLDSFQDTQTVIDQVLTIMGDLRRQGLVGRSLYESLYFSRAFNRVAWANKLLIGTAWKNYVICPPTDVIGMMSMAMLDLDQLLVLQDLPPSLKAMAIPTKDKDPAQMINDRYADKFKQLPKDSLEMKMYRFMNFEEDPANLARLTSKRTLNQVYGVLEYYNMPETQQMIALGKTNYTLERILSKDNQPFFKVYEQLVTMIGIY